MPRNPEQVLAMSNTSFAKTAEDQPVPEQYSYSTAPKCENPGLLDALDELEADLGEPILKTAPFSELL